MPSPRRMRLLMLATVVTVVFLLIYTSNSRTGKDVEDRPLNDFYHRTKDAMSKVGGSGSVKGQAIINAKTGKKAGHIPADKDGDGDIDEDDKVAGEQLQQRLHAVAQEAKEKANEKGGLKPDRPSKVIGIGSSAEGQKKGMGAGDAGDVKPAAAAAPAVKEPEKVKAKAVEAKDKSMEAPKPKVDTKESKEEHDAEVELNKILKQAPVIIFSKTYCPHSKRAKGILLEKYHITPDPYVVELDKHPLGSHLQDYLQVKTGRRTVPNVMINGISIGGADDIVSLDNSDKLIAKILDLGLKRVKVSERFAPSEHS